MNRLTILMLSFVLICACNSLESNDIVRNSENVRSDLVFEATIDQTKTSFNAGKVSWLQNDEISISDGDQIAVFEVSSIENGIATFRIKEGQPELKTSAATYTAWYPASIAQGLSSIEVNAPGEELSMLPMGAVSQNAKLVFSNLCALIKFRVSSNSEGLGLKAVKISADKSLSGAFKIVNNAAVMNSEAAGAVSISSQGDEGFLFSEKPIELYLPVPEGNYSSFSIEAVASNGVKKVFPLSAESIEIKRNTIYTKNLVLDDLDLNDFREEGAANCYIASHKGKYRFAAVRGDGSPIDNIKTVSVIWRYNNTVAGPDDGTIIEELSYKDGVIDFKTDDVLGSALIGALDDSGTILWSWHIWRTDGVPADVNYPDGILMDRYLGALSNTPGDIKSVGLMYQYGRKDPFPGRVVNGNTIGTFNGLAYSEQGGPVDIETAVQNPNVRYYGTDSNFWTTAEAREGANWDGETKSVQDPCPKGYRVPANNIFGSTAKADIQKLFTWNSSLAGFDFMNGAAWYPATGQLAPKGKNLNSGILISFSWCRSHNTNGNPLLLDLRNSTVNGWSGGAAAAGFAVRCEKSVN